MQMQLQIVAITIVAITIVAILDTIVAILDTIAKEAIQMQTQFRTEANANAIANRGYYNR